MQCVSYTRYVSSMPEREVPADIIIQQNKRIAKYARSKGWQISKKYTDRKNDKKADAAFKQLREDGMARQFDMLVIDSFYRLGNNISVARNLLQEIFYPAGIHFAIVEDDFCSLDISGEELKRYIAEKYADHRTKTRWSAIMDDRADGHFTVHDEKYGYLLSEDRTEMVIDEEVVPAIRRVFTMMADGSTMKEIAENMNAEGYESPEAHLRRVGKKNRPQRQNDHWTANTIKSVCRCTDYMGTMRRKIHDEYVDLPVPRIIEPELFHKAEETRQQHSHSMPSIRPQPNAFRFIIRDWETRQRLLCIAYVRGSDDRNFCLDSKRQGRRMPYKKALSEVMKLLQVEILQARSAAAILRSEQGQILHEERKAEVAGRMRDIMQEISDLAIERIEIHGREEDISFGYILSKNDRRLEELEQKFQKLIEEMNTVDKAFTHNPWIELYENIVLDGEPTNAMVRKWIDTVWVHDFKTVTADMKHKEWKAMLPEEWRKEVRTDGKEE